MEKTGDFYIGGGGYLGKYRNFVSFVHITVNVDLWFHLSYLGGMGYRFGSDLTLLGHPIIVCIRIAYRGALCYDGCTVRDWPSPNYKGN